MATRKKFSTRKKFAEQDEKDSRIFFIVLVGITIGLVVLLYFLFT